MVNSGAMVPSGGALQNNGGVQYPINAQTGPAGQYRQSEWEAGHLDLEPVPVQQQPSRFAVSCHYV